MKKGIGQKEKRKAAITNQTGLGRNGRKKFRSNIYIYFLKVSVGFDFLFPDSPHDLFCCEYCVMGGGGKGINSINNNLGIKKSADHFS